MNHYPHHIGDYDSRTAHLEWVEDMAYTRLLRLYYRSERPISADLSEACRLVRAKSKDERKAVETVLKEFFTLQDDGWHNERADEEIAIYQAKADANRKNGKAGGRPRKTHEEPQNNPSGYGDVTQPTTQNNLNQNQNQNQNQEKTKDSAFALPDWVPAEPWSDWLEVRRKIKAPNTAKAMSLAVKALEKLRDDGDDPAEVLNQSVMRGWRGIFPINGKQKAPDYSGIFNDA